LAEIWEHVDDSGYVEELEKDEGRTERFEALEEQLEALAAAVPAWTVRRKYRCPVVHRGRITDHRLTRRKAPLRNGCMVSEQLKDVVRQRKAAEQKAKCRDRRRLHRAYGPAAATVRTATQAACGAVEALWDPESDEGDDGYGSPSRPSYDFDRLEPQAVKALARLADVLAAAVKAMALAVICLSRPDRRALLHGRRHAPTLESNCERRRREALPDPGQILSASPHVTNGPPRLRVALTSDVLVSVAA